MAAPVVESIPRPTAGAGRLLSVDVLRGVTVLLMILVNNPGSRRAAYFPLRHAAWNGWTLTDLVFPFFLFIVGISVVLSFGRRRASGERRGKMLFHVVWRCLALVAIGLIMNGLFYLPWEQVRIPGVLQRIGIVYLAVALLTLLTTRRVRLAATIALLLGYWAVLMLGAAPGHHAGDLTPAGNLASYIDRRVMGGHLWRPLYDPEGLLSTLPAIASALAGTLAGDWLLSSANKRRIAAGLIAAGALSLVVGRAWGVVFPINKNLWTSSFVVFTAGWALLMLGAAYWAVQVRGWRRWGEPFAWVGMNPLAIYVGSEILAMAALPALRHSAMRSVLTPFAGGATASLLWALGYTLLWWAVAWLLYRKTIFIRL